MARSMTCSTLAVLLLAAVVVSSQPNVVSALKKPLVLKYYVHDNIIPGPNSTAVQVASASGNDTTGALPLFGDVTVFESVMRTGAEPSSDFIGLKGGELVSLKKPFYYWITFTAEFNTTMYKGTYSGQGQFDGAAITHEVAVIGGTGDFRGVRGYAVAERIIPAAGIDPTDVVLMYTSYLYM
ncbi:hypothetical protein Mapa_009629 [Marchantia paleacea]|nr:hypothetical protein Mapa_009629 [Marchantia paleacea]